MFDNVNGFVPSSHTNGHDPADSNGFSSSQGPQRPPEAHYSPVSGLTGGPAADPESVANSPASEASGPDLTTVPEAEALAEVMGAATSEDDVAAAEPPLSTDPGPLAQANIEHPASVGPYEPGEVEAEAQAGLSPIDDERPVQPDGDERANPEPEAVDLDPSHPLPVGRPPSPLELDAQVESLLFVADGPAPIGKLAEALEVKVGAVEAALALLEERYQGRGISIQRIKDRVQLTTAPTAAGLIQRFLGLSATAPLSKAALETLAIIAYRQPITRPQIEQVRGVNSDSVIKNLLTKGLVEEAGIAEGPGRPVLYITTPEFLQHFGLSALTDLPALNLDDVRRSFASEILKG